MEIKAYSVPPRFEVKWEERRNEVIVLFAVDHSREQIAVLAKVSVNTIYHTREEAVTLLQAVFGDVLSDDNYDIVSNYDEYADAPIAYTVHLWRFSVNVLYSEPPVRPRFAEWVRRHSFLDVLSYAEARQETNPEMALEILDAEIEHRDTAVARAQRAALRYRTGDVVGGDVDALQVLAMSQGNKVGPKTQIRNLMKGTKYAHEILECLK